MDLGLQHFIYGRSNIAHIVRDQQELGAHTDVIEFQSRKTSTFRWTHPGARPMGFGISNQCPSCDRLKTVKPIPNKNKYQASMACNVCDYSKDYDCPSGWDWTYGPPIKGDVQGAWLVHVTTEGHDNFMDVT